MMIEGMQAEWNQFVEKLLKCGNPHLEKHLTKPLVQHLISMCVMRLIPHQTGVRPENWEENRPYLCMEHLILENGAYFVGQKLPKGYKRGTPKYCYSNSCEALRKYGKKELLYVEGFVQAIIPIQHAWNIDSSNQVIELTLKDNDMHPLNGTEYFGIVFTTEYKQDEDRRKITKAVAKGTRDYNPSSIDNWEDGFPLLFNRELVKEASISPTQIPLLD
jgi:hypothetical protein